MVNLAVHHTENSLTIENFYMKTETFLNKKCTCVFKFLKHFYFSLTISQLWWDNVSLGCSSHKMKTKYMVLSLPDTLSNILLVFSTNHSVNSRGGVGDARA